LASSFNPFFSSRVLEAFWVPSRILFSSHVPRYNLPFSVPGLLDDTFLYEIFFLFVRSPYHPPPPVWGFFSRVLPRMKRPERFSSGRKIFSYIWRAFRSLQSPFSPFPFRSSLRGAKHEGVPFSFSFPKLRWALRTHLSPPSVFPFFIFSFSERLFPFLVRRSLAVSKCSFFLGHTHPTKTPTPPPPHPPPPPPPTPPRLLFCSSFDFCALLAKFFFAS